MESSKTISKLQLEVEELRRQLEEANDTIEAIRTGQIDALVVDDYHGPQLYTLQSADITYRVFIEKMSEGAATLNQDGMIMYCNHQFATPVGESLSSIIGTPFFRYLSDSCSNIFSEALMSCVREDCRVEVELKQTQKMVPVQLSLSALELEDGLVLSMIMTDLTELRKNEQALQENNKKLELTNLALEVSNQDLQQFASVASHDLQEPLRKIQMFTERLSEHEMDLQSSVTKRYLSKINNSAKRMKELVLDILNYSKLSANGEQYEATDLNALVREIIEDLEMQINSKQAIVTVGNLPTIDANSGQLRQVFQNIISNALKFSKETEPPVVNVSATRIEDAEFDSLPAKNGRYWLFEIADNGIGFEQKFLHNIFALFERLHSKDTFEGTGIGLAISKKIIEKHKGIITASGVPDKGSVFSFILPATRDS